MVIFLTKTETTLFRSKMDHKYAAALLKIDEQLHKIPELNLNDFAWMEKCASKSKCAIYTRTTNGVFLHEIWLLVAQFLDDKNAANLSISLDNPTGDEIWFRHCQHLDHRTYVLVGLDLNPVTAPHMFDNKMFWVFISRPDLFNAMWKNQQKLGTTERKTLKRSIQFGSYQAWKKAIEDARIDANIAKNHPYDCTCIFCQDNRLERMEKRHVSWW